MNNRTAFSKHIFSLLLFGSNGVVASFISLSSYEIVLLRSLLGCALLIALFFCAGNKPELRGCGRELLLIAISGAAMAADWLFLFEAYSEIGVSLSLIINYTGPAIVVALSHLILKEKTSPAKLAGVLFALMGAAMICGNAVYSGLNARGLFFAALSALSYAAMVLSNKKAEKITGVRNAALQLFFTTVCVVIFSLLRGVSISLSSSGLVYVLWLGLLNTGLGCYFYFSSIGNLSAQSVALCGYIEPLSAVLFSAVFLKESLSAMQIAGACFIIGGALFGELFAFKRPGKAA